MCVSSASLSLFRICGYYDYYVAFLCFRLDVCVVRFVLMLYFALFSLLVYVLLSVCFLFGLLSPAWCFAVVSITIVCFVVFVCLLFCSGCLLFPTLSFVIINCYLLLFVYVSSGFLFFVAFVTVCASFVICVCLCFVRFLLFVVVFVLFVILLLFVFVLFGWFVPFCYLLLLSPSLCLFVCGCSFDLFFLLLMFSF